MSDEKTALDIAEEIIASMRQVIDAMREMIEAEDRGHEHHWDVIDTQLPEGPFHPRLQGYTTIALIRCDICQLPQTLVLSGKWNREQVRGIVNASDPTSNAS